MRMIALSEVNKDIKVVDNKLFFGTHEVQYAEHIKEDKIAALYVIRYKHSSEDKSWRFSTGFDLVGNQFWIGGCKVKGTRREVSLPPVFVDSFYAVERILNDIAEDTSGRLWAIFEEEDFEKAFAEMQEEWD